MSIRQALHAIASGMRDCSFTLRYWDGSETHYGNPPYEFSVEFRDKVTAAALLSNLPLRFGEAYMSGAIEIHGDMNRLLQLVTSGATDRVRMGLASRLGVAVARWQTRNVRGQARENVSRHYDLGNDFYGLWLDEAMVYSCAYFKAPTDSLAVAQQQKLAHLCSKLRLSPDQRVLDIGCGWGAFAIHAAQRHAVQVFGVTLSHNQHKLAAERIREKHLDNKVSVQLLDYRDISVEQPFDRIASIGMFEHVGKRQYIEYFTHNARLLANGGIGVLQTIGRMSAAPPDPWIEKYIFPGIYFPALSEVTSAMERCGLVIVDVEVLRLHYAQTLDKWAEAFEATVDQVQNAYDERFVRMWRLYLRSSAAAFRHGNLTLWQIQFTKGRCNSLELTRDYLYK